jgi:hypothetical protein
MSAPAKRRNPFEDISEQDRAEAMRKLAAIIDRSSRYLGKPTPDEVKPYLPATRTS